MGERRHTSRVPEKADGDAEELSHWFGDYDAAFNPKR
jgi:hypothetical protein